MAGISGCKYFDSMSVRKFNMDIQYVSMTSHLFDNILIIWIIRDKRLEFQTD
jgi:hypothetical protein